MCGISGIFSKSCIDVHSLHQMNSIISHRGPDDEGFTLFNDATVEMLGSSDTCDSLWSSNYKYSPKRDINTASIVAKGGFGHRRLSILDLSPKGHQPMCSNCERYWITYNGEIYNYVEIREELIQLGYSFQTGTDTEVILASYAEWGVDCQNKFNGMWAFAIFDRIDQTIFISRDRFGIKPLYYWTCPKGDFYFASEIKQFTVVENWKAVLNKKRAFDYLYFSFTDHTDETFFTGVFSIPPGSYFFGKAGQKFMPNERIFSEKWYKPVIQKSRLGFNQVKEQFLEKFKLAVNLQMRSDVKVGVSLSGGLDSSAVTCYASELIQGQNNSEKIHTYSSCSVDERFDERKWVEEVVAHSKTSSHINYPSGDDVFELTDKLIWHMDEPYQSQSVMLGHEVYKMAKDNGTAVILNGQGADEYLSGYGLFRLMRRKRLLRSLKFRKLLQDVDDWQELKNVIRGFFLDGLPKGVRYNLSFYGKSNHYANKVINWKALIDKRSHPFSLFKGRKSSNLDLSNQQLFKDPLQKYLRWEDRNSMANSIEARVPFLDHNLVEFCQSLPLDFLDSKNHSKRLLVESMEGLIPEKVRLRKDKKGFITPEELWLTDNYEAEFTSMLESNLSFAKGIIKEDEAREYLRKMQNREVEFDYFYWRIILFCVWMRVFEVELQ
jgi:asparagine synthase (glutamine-hydrolysing)